MKNLDSDYTNMSYDPHNKYSLSYFFGTVGIYIIRKNILTQTLIVGVIYINLNIK